jgi:hypothetical protein
LSATTAIFSRLNGWRPIAAATVPAARSGAPQTSARYSRLSDPLRPWSANSAARPWWAASFLATTSRPDVSLSRRWTIPGRLTPPTPDRLSPQWRISALTSVPAAWPGAGWTTSPAGLSTIEQMLVLEHDRQRQVLAGDRRVLGRRHGERDLLRLRRPAPPDRAPRRRRSSLDQPQSAPSAACEKGRARAPRPSG